MKGVNPNYYLFIESAESTKIILCYIADVKKTFERELVVAIYFINTLTVSHQGRVVLRIKHRYKGRKGTNSRCTKSMTVKKSVCVCLKEIVRRKHTESHGRENFQWCSAPILQWEVRMGLNKKQLVIRELLLLSSLKVRGSWSKELDLCSNSLNQAWIPQALYDPYGFGAPMNVIILLLYSCGKCYMHNDHTAWGKKRSDFTRGR